MNAFYLLLAILTSICTTSAQVGAVEVLRLKGHERFDTPPLRVSEDGVVLCVSNGYSQKSTLIGVAAGGVTRILTVVDLDLTHAVVTGDRLFCAVRRSNPDSVLLSETLNANDRHYYPIINERGPARISLISSVGGNVVAYDELRGPVLFDLTLANPRIIMPNWESSWHDYYEIFSLRDTTYMIGTTHLRKIANATGEWKIDGSTGRLSGNSISVVDDSVRWIDSKGMLWSVNIENHGCKVRKVVQADPWVTACAGRNGLLLFLGVWDAVDKRTLAYVRYERDTVVTFTVPGCSDTACLPAISGVSGWRDGVFYFVNAESDTAKVLYQFVEPDPLTSVNPDSNPAVETPRTFSLIMSAKDFIDRAYAKDVQSCTDLNGREISINDVHENGIYYVRSGDTQYLVMVIF